VENTQTGSDQRANRRILFYLAISPALKDAGCG